MGAEDEADFLRLPSHMGGADDAALHLNLESWEGPLDLLLSMARQQKVDLRQISILELVEQYLNFINNARALKLEVAADYLVMAAWLAYLKSAMLLPKMAEEQPSPDELALRLQLRLQRLNAMREAAARLLARDVLGREHFLRGEFEGLKEVKHRRWDASLFDLMQSYGQVKLRTKPAAHLISRRPIMTLEEAMTRLQIWLGTDVSWTDLREFLPADTSGLMRKSAKASIFLAVLEMAKQGKVELQQEAAFAPLLVKARVA